jgi:hypothetical protein
MIFKTLALCKIGRVETVELADDQQIGVLDSKSSLFSLNMLKVCASMSMVVRNSSLDLKGLRTIAAITISAPMSRTALTGRLLSDTIDQERIAPINRAEDAGYCHCRPHSHRQRAAFKNHFRAGGQIDGNATEGYHQTIEIIYRQIWQTSRVMYSVIF